MNANIEGASLSKQSNVHTIDLETNIQCSSIVVLCATIDIRAHKFLYSLQQLMLLDYSIKHALKLTNRQL